MDLVSDYFINARQPTRADWKLGKNKIDKDMPDEAVLAAMENENVKVGKLVHEFLGAQSLKILPQAPFGDAVTQFVDKDDKHAMEAFVNESLTIQVRDLLAREDDDEDLDPAIERLRTQQERLFAEGQLKLPKKKGILRPRPMAWDSDEDGPWEDSELAYEQPDEDDDDEDGTPAPAAKRGRAAKLAGSDDDNASIISSTTKQTATKKAPAKKAPAKPRAPAKAKAPTKTPARAKKSVVEVSDDEDDDVMMFDAPSTAKAQPKRAAAAKGRQTQLNFSQPAKSQTARELSDDEISDEDAFEPMPSSKTSRKR